MARRTKSEDQDLSLVESTGNVEFDGTPVTAEQPAENQSSGNVEYEAPGTIEVSHYTEDVIIRVETPGPVTVNFPGLPGVANKVIEPPAPETERAQEAPAEPAPADPAPVDPAE
ncbi:hypothetical protein [Pseudarthrobacter sp. NIBRBAC000502770]|uniref:hypothetical protein n=1 Tax=Pseudarthrobacter sp. NIBRBAC000502770 TaxID=2590785 RepID=UPI0011407532|nr:hypothetical protein [Pseudarthrobacter sp. NIBRBAC000502770]QDG88861.1 hypothetical protein NIBR502770_10525 [Pseudarthrobacter sp. NIBRBAC000502770]